MEMPSGWRSSEPVPRAEHQRQRREERRHRRHQNRAEAQQARLIDRVARRFALVALRHEREVDHHDGVLLHDADQKHDADDRDDVEIVARDHQRQQRAHAGRRQRRKDRDRMDVALIEHAQHDIDGDDGGEDQQQLVAERGLEGERRALEARDDARRAGRYLSRPACTASTAAPSEALGATSNEIVADGNCARWSISSGTGVCIDLGDGVERHLAVRSGRADRSSRAS